MLPLRLRRNPDTGLSYHWNRWFDPGLGKWLTPDPIGFAAGDANLYRYVGNHPTGATDPSGLVEETRGGSSGRVRTFGTAFQAVAGAMVAKAAGILHGMDSAEQVSSGAGNSILWSATKMGVANGEHALGSIASIGTQEFAERQTAFSLSAAANTSVFFEQQHRDDIFRSIYFLETGEFAPPTALDVFHQFSSLSYSPRIADRSYDFLVTASSGLNGTSARAGAPWGVVAESVVFELATMGIAPSIETAPVRLSRTGSAADSSLHWIDNLPPWKNNQLAGKWGAASKLAENLATRNWPVASIEKAIARHAGEKHTTWITKTGKRIYENPTTGRQIVHDLEGGYFRIFQPESIGSQKGIYLNMLGNELRPARIGKNGVYNPLLRDVDKGLWQQETHFFIEELLKGLR